MSEKNKWAFVKWWNGKPEDGTPTFTEVWLAACAYKEREALESLREWADENVTATKGFTGLRIRYASLQQEIDRRLAALKDADATAAADDAPKEDGGGEK